MMRRSFVIVAALLFAAASHAVVTQGISPELNIAGTGTVWSGSALVSGKAAGSYTTAAQGSLVYREDWATSQNISSIMLSGSSRTFGGEIFVSTTLGGDYTTSLGRFSGDTFDVLIRNTPAEGVFGVKIVLDELSSDGHYQFGQVSIFSTPQPLALENLAAGMTTIHSDSPQWAGGNVTDGNFGSPEWRSSNSLPVNWVGFEVPDGGTIDITHLCVVGGPRHGTGNSYCMWKDFDVQVMQNGVWSDSLIRVNIIGDEDICWIDFGEEITVQGVRLYGSDASESNPVANNASAGNGKIVSEIMAFNFTPIPEPATMTLLALGGLAMLRRRR